jgi:hypothetical protein
MNAKPRGSYREVRIEDKFGAHARSPAKLTREVAIKRAEAELAMIKPRIENYVKLECKRLENVLRAALARDANYTAHVHEAYQYSRNIRDVAGSIGYSLIGFIATNLCTIVEAADAAHMDYPAAVIDCHYDALRLAFSRAYFGKNLKDVPELSAGLLQTVQVAKVMAARATAAAATAQSAAKPG